MNDFIRGLSFLIEWHISTGNSSKGVIFIINFELTPAFSAGKPIKQYQDEANDKNPIPLATLTYRHYQVTCVAEIFWKERIMFHLIDTAEGIEKTSHRTFPETYSEQQMMHSMFIILKEMVPALPLDVIPYYCSQVKNADKSALTFVTKLSEIIFDTTFGIVPYQIIHQVQDDNVDIHCYYEEHPHMATLIKQTMNQLRDELLIKKTP